MDKSTTMDIVEFVFVVFLRIGHTMLYDAICFEHLWLWLHTGYVSYDGGKI